MADQDIPQVTLITPPAIDLSTFPEALARVMDACPIACLRLALSTRDEDTLTRAADVIRDVAHQRDVMVVIDTHVLLSQRLGLDGVHLLDGARSVRSARKTLGEDAIVGAFCGQSRHDGMTAGEAGSDYVTFGPVGVTTLGDGAQAEPDLFEWWSEMIEVPVIAEGALTLEDITRLAPVTDFFAIGEEIWSTDDPAATLKAFHAAMGATG